MSIYFDIFYVDFYFFVAKDLAKVEVPKVTFELRIIRFMDDSNVVRLRSISTVICIVAHRGNTISLAGHFHVAYKKVVRQFSPLV